MDHQVAVLLKNSLEDEHVAAEGRQSRGGEQSRD
jgi:hypothetical protein